jgi:hypothetical protein
MSTMNLEEALEYLGDGHLIIEVDKARAICETLDIPFPSSRIMRWKSREDSWNRYGAWPNRDEPGEGVACLSLSDHAVRTFKLTVYQVIGRGTQAELNAEALKAHFSKKG